METIILLEDCQNLLQKLWKERDAALARLAELEKQEPKRPGWYQNPTDECWFECPDDAEILDSVFYDEAPKVGDEFELDVCWNGKQKFRVTKIEDAESDDVEVEFVNGTQLFTAAGASPVEPAKDHEIAALVNQLTSIAKEFHSHQSLRERVAQLVRPWAQPSQAGEPTEAQLIAGVKAMRLFVTKLSIKDFRDGFVAAINAKGDV